MNGSGYFSCTLGGAALVAIFVLTRWRAAAPRSANTHGEILGFLWKTIGKP